MHSSSTYWGLYRGFFWGNLQVLRPTKCHIKICLCMEGLPWDKLCMLVMVWQPYANAYKPRIHRMILWHHVEIVGGLEWQQYWAILEYLWYHFGTINAWNFETLLESWWGTVGTPFNSISVATRQGIIPSIYESL